MSIDPSMPVGTLAARLPFVVGILEHERIDYHLGGAQSLRDACAAAHAPLERVLGQIQRAVSRPRDNAMDWLIAPLDEVMDHIVEGHHLFTRALCRRVRQNLAEALRIHHGWTRLVQLDRVFDGFEEDLLSHLDKEEAHVFPYIKVLNQHGRTRAPFSTVDYPVRIMHFEHESQEDALQELREVTDGWSAPPRSCAALRAVHADLSALERDLHEHLHLENNVLFPRAVELEREARP